IFNIIKNARAVLEILLRKLGTGVTIKISMIIGLLELFGTHTDVPTSDLAEGMIM
ncbi:hypothetical protein TWF506_008583, partial [Arthrobotrys conoides]